MGNLRLCSQLKAYLATSHMLDILFETLILRNKAETPMYVNHCSLVEQNPQNDSIYWEFVRVSCRLQYGQPQNACLPLEHPRIQSWFSPQLQISQLVFTICQNHKEVSSDTSEGGISVEGLITWPVRMRASRQKAKDVLLHLFIQPVLRRCVLDLGKASHLK